MRATVLVATLLTALAAPPVGAQDDTDGSALSQDQDAGAALQGRAGGTDMTWHVVDLGESSGSYWADMGTLHQVTVFAFPDADGLSLAGAMEFSLTLDSREDPMRAIAAQVAFFPEGRQTAFAVPPAREGRVDVTLESSEIAGGRLHLRGRFATPLQRMVDVASGRFDPEDSIDIEVSFDLSVSPF